MERVQPGLSASSKPLALAFRDGFINKLRGRCVDLPLKQQSLWVGGYNMRSIIMALLAMGNVTVRDIPVKKHETPIVSVPDLYIGFRQREDDTLLEYDPRVSIEYPLWSGKWLRHAIEMTYIIYWIEYQCRKDIRGSWESHVLALHLHMADEIGWRSGPYYDLEKSYDVTGATFADLDRYRLVVEVNGFTSHDLSAPQNIHGQFCDRYASQWIYGHDRAGYASLPARQRDYVM